MLIIKLIFWVVAICLVSLGAWCGRFVPFSQQWPLFEALRTTAAIIFAVIGAWLAIIYPDRLKMSYKNFAAAHRKDVDASGELFTPVVHSTLILCVILVLGVTAPILKQIGVPGPIECWRGASYGLLVLLTLWQLWTVFLTLDPADRVKSFMARESRHRSNVNALRGGR